MDPKNAENWTVHLGSLSPEWQYEFLVDRVLTTETATQRDSPEGDWPEKALTRHEIQCTKRNIYLAKNEGKEIHRRRIPLPKR